MNNHYAKGLLAGLIATLVLSALMVMKAAMGLMPALDLPQMIAGMLGSTSLVLGWVMHFAIGIVIYGVAIAELGRHLPGGDVVHGLIIATAGWLIMMVALMPMVGAGLFGMSLGPMAPLMTLVLHLIFGAVLGLAYGRLRTAV